GQRARDVQLPSHRAHPLAILNRPLEKVRELLIAKLRPRILDLDYNLAAAQEGAQHHLAAFGPLDAVAEEIGHDTLEVQRIEASTRHPAQLGAHPQALKPCLATVDVGHFLNDDVGIDDPRMRLKV